MLKLLIADSSNIVTHSLSQILIAHYELRVCSDGNIALDILAEFQPDILIINLMLPHVDGLGVLQKTVFKPKIIMALTTYVSNYMEHLLTELGVDYIMIAPSSHSLRSRLEDLLRKQVIISDPQNARSLTTAYLHALNVPTHLDGYRHLCVAIPKYAEDPTQLITKELYPAVAELCDSKDGRAVEHAIRTAIQIAWSHRNDNIWHKYFPPDADGAIPCPTNKEFICCLAEYLQR